jgi:NCS1 family nucleobase:cation symporter-1
MWSRPGAGGAFLFGLPMDIVIALPVSWIPLVADYNRYSRNQRGSFIGTSVGFFVANVWFFALGTLLILRSPETPVNPEGIALGILSLAGLSLTGSLLLAGRVVGETDEAFADVYSAAVSLRNIFPRVDNRIFVVGVIVVSVALAGRFTMLAYELFLFLLGSIFIPLLGVWLADYYLLGNRRERTGGIRIGSLIAWLIGFAIYHWIAPTPLTWWMSITSTIFGSPLTSRFTWLGASIPSFVAAFAIHAVVGSLINRNRRVEVSNEA